MGPSAFLSHCMDSCKFILLVDTVVGKQGGVGPFLMRDETARLCEASNKCGVSVSLHSWEEVGWGSVGVVCRSGHKLVGTLASETELQGPESQAVRESEHAHLPSMLGVGRNQQVAMCKACWE